MKRLNNIVLATGFLLAISSEAQTVTLDMESGNRNADAANCWYFPGTSYINSSEKISGTYSGRTGQLTGNYANMNGVISPYIKFNGTGNVTFKMKLNAWSGSTWRRFVLMTESANNIGGAKDTLYSFTFTSSNATTVQMPTVSVASLTGIYRVYFYFAGVGGTARGVIDDISISGEYWADPLNNCAPLPLVQDADGDGVADADDAFPEDKYRAYQFGMERFATIMFEDLWPAKGDYDFNDLVVDFKSQVISNAENKVVEAYLTFVTRAIGASYHNGFAFQINDLSPEHVIKVKGSKLQGKLFSLNENGTEANQKKLNIPVFDDAYNLLPYMGGNGGVNVNPDVKSTDADTTIIYIVFMEDGKEASGGAISSEEMMKVVFNPYLIVNQEREREVHLADFEPTNLASEKYFGMDQDDTNPGEGRYYRTKNNLPWALFVESSIPYTSNTNEFGTAYTKFIEWAESNGERYGDWYTENPEYRNEKFLYPH